MKYLLVTGPDGLAIAHGRRHVYCCLVCYCYSAHFRLPTSLLKGDWINLRINMNGAWLAICNRIWKEAEMIRCLTWSHLYLAVDRFNISPGTVGAPHNSSSWNISFLSYPAVPERLAVGGWRHRRLPQGETGGERTAVGTLRDWEQWPGLQFRKCFCS